MTASPRSAIPAKFVTGSLMRHVVVMSLSGTLGLSVTFLVDFLALWWISRLGQEHLIAAVGIAGTIQFAAMSIAIGMMIGGVAMVSRALGQGKTERARKIATASLLLTTAVQTTIALLLYIFRLPVLRFSGAEGEVLAAADHFLSLSLPSLPLVAAGIMCSALLRGAGDAWRSMLVTVAGGAVAVIFDPALIVWSGWGITGAAISIVASRAVMAAAGIWFILRPHHLLARPSMAHARMLAGPFFAIALPAIGTQVSTPFGNWVLTRAISDFGDSAVAGWGVVMRLTILAFGGIFALSGAIGGIIGQNHGAGRPDRVAEAYVAALKFCVVYTLTVWMLMWALSGQVALAFNLSAEGAQIVRAFTHVTAGTFLFTGALFVSNAAFNNLGRPLASTLANWTRDGLLMYPLALALGAAFAGPGIVYAQGAANVIVGTLAAIAAWRFIHSRARAHASDAAAA